MVGRDKGSLALHCLVMQLSGTVYSTFKVTNSSQEQRKASNTSTPNLWKLKKDNNCYSKSCIHTRQFPGDINVTNQSAAVASQFVNEQRTEPMLQIVFTSVVSSLKMFTCKPYF